MRHSIRSLWGNTDGAVAPTVALSLTALIAAGGIAFDYSRMATMDTELQGAADQAALAAASQLDGETGACSRAANAAVSMVANRTYMANDGNGMAIVIPLESPCDATGQVKFYQDAAHTQAATSDANAKFVMVTVNARTANFTLTPIVAAFSSGAIGATAYAGLNSAICKIPPVMLCNPAESKDPNFTVANYVGKGIRLISNDGGGSYAPGNFGFLATNAGNGASVLAQELGRSNVPGDCVQGDGVTTDPGNMISVRDALNTRFGIYTSVNQACGNSGSLCPPSNNIRQDLVLRGRTAGKSGNTSYGGSLNDLGFTPNSGSSPGWEEAANPYPGSANIGKADHAPLSDAEISSIAPMGYPEDVCHSFSSSGTGDCAGGLIGDGNWDRYAYFKSNSANYGLDVTSTSTLSAFLTSTFGTTSPSRYKVYQWEMARASTRLQFQSAGTGLRGYANPADLTGEPTGISPSSTVTDRRVISAAVINCTAQGLNGKSSNVKVQKWIDLFLVQPSEPRTVGVRTANSDVYVELIGETNDAGNSGAVQLVKKSVPYLIE
jgi:Flp pilus assembly protein TadG